MAQVTLTIHNKDFTIACQDGQEEILKQVGKKLNEKVSSLSQSFPSAETEYLMVFANLILADEMNAMQNKINELEKKLTEETNGQQETSVTALRLENIATQIEGIISKLEKL